MKIARFIIIAATALAIIVCSHSSGGIKPPPMPDSTNVLFDNINLVDMTADRVKKNQSVLVKGGQIVAIGSSDSLAVPENARVINGTGAYLMPGLCDMHIHTRSGWANWPVLPFHLYLANGVTTVRCLGPRGGDGTYALKWKQQIQAGQLTGPFIYVAGPILYGPVQNPSQAVQQRIEAGFDLIKLYSFLSRQEFSEAMTQAKKNNIYTVGHIPFRPGLDGVVETGMDEIAHIEELAWETVIFDKNLKLKGRRWLEYVIKMAYKQYKAAYAGMSAGELDRLLGRTIDRSVRKLSAAGIPVCTTLYIDTVIIEKLFDPEKFISKPVNRYLPREYHQAFRQKKEKHQIQFKGGEDFALFKQKLDLVILKHLKHHNVELILGTDSGTGGMGIVPGFSIHEDLRILTENGYTPFEAIKTGTVNAGRIIRKMSGNANIGTIEKGKKADLILVRDNPLENVSNVKKIMGVMASGRWYDNTMLDKMSKR